MDIKDIRRINPLELLVPDRLDIVIKYLFINALVNKHNVEYFTNLYTRHILKRTRGIKTVYGYQNGNPVIISTKTGIEEYISDFCAMIESFKNNGFQKEFFIPVSSQNGIILDGAHRTSCSIFFNIEPYVIYENRLGRTWDYKWLEDNQFTTEDINIIVDTYIKLKRENVFAAIFWGPLKEHWEEMQEEIQKDYKILMTRDFHFKKSDFESIVYDIYSYEFGPSVPEKISRKINLLEDYNTDFRLLFFYVDEPQYSQTAQGIRCNQVVKLKDKLRSKFDYIIEKEKFITVHMADNGEHTEHIKNILLSPNNLKHVSARKSTHFRSEFLDWLLEYEKVLEKYNIPKERCCIVGSGPLEVLGVRESTDIDFILDSRIRDVLFDDKSRTLS